MALRATKQLFDRRYTADEFEKMPEFDGRYELLDGRLVKKGVPGDEHGSIVRKIITIIVLLDPAGNLGKWWTNTSFQLDQWWEPIPDFGFVVNRRVPPTTKGAVKAIPDLVVEVHSPSDLATQKKRNEAATKIEKYQAKGVQIIWAINPARRQVEVYKPDQATPVAILGVDDVLKAESVIPGLEIPVVNLFN